MSTTFKLICTPKRPLVKGEAPLTYHYDHELSQFEIDQMRVWLRKQYGEEFQIKGVGQSDGKFIAYLDELKPGESIAIGPFEQTVTVDLASKGQTVSYGLFGLKAWWQRIKKK